jgi:urease accessory protein
MRRAIKVVPAGTWSTDCAGGTVTLTFENRHRRRIRLTDDAGEPFLLDLTTTALLCDGDGLLLEDGSCLGVLAAPEEVVDILPASQAEAARIAWHIGNRHIPLQVLPTGGLRIRDDPVLIQMLAGLGAVTHRWLAPFTPEPGAYAPRHALPDHDDH